MRTIQPTLRVPANPSTRSTSRSNLQPDQLTGDPDVLNQLPSPTVPANMAYYQTYYQETPAYRADYQSFYPMAPVDSRRTDYQSFYPTAPVARSPPGGVLSAGAGTGLLVDLRAMASTFVPGRTVHAGLGQYKGFLYVNGS